MSLDQSSLTPLLVAAGGGPYALSNDVLFAHDAEISGVDSSSYLKVKEINVGYFSGIIRVAFKLKAPVGTHWVSARVYKNGVALGTEQGQDNVAYVEYSEDLAFGVNDLLQLYVKNSDAGQMPTVKDFRILGKFPIPTVPAVTL